VIKLIVDSNKHQNIYFIQSSLYQILFRVFFLYLFYLKFQVFYSLILNVVISVQLQNKHLDYWRLILKQFSFII
jgi:hypothetical protein